LILKVYRDDEFLRDLGLKWPRVTIGSAEGATLPLTGPEVNAEHAVLTEKDGKYFVTPGDPGAVLFFNGTALPFGTEIDLGGGDEIAFGDFRIEVRGVTGDGTAPDGVPRDSSEYFSRARVLKELQMTERALDHLVSVGKIDAVDYHGTWVFPKESVLTFRDRIQAHTTKKMDKLAPAQPQAFLDFDEVVAILDVDPPTLNAFVSSGKIRAFRSDDQIKFRAEDVSVLFRNKRDGRGAFPGDGAVIVDAVSEGAVLDEGGEEAEVEEDETEETAEGPPPPQAPPRAPREGEPSPARRETALISVHYYLRMTPRKNFPLVVQGKVSRPVRLVPSFPGCICVPPQATVSAEKPRAEIWVTPFASGAVPSAEIHVFDREAPLHPFRTPFRSQGTTAALVLLIVSPVWILLGLVLDLIPRTDEKQEHLLSLVLDAAGGPLSLGLALFILTFGIGVLLYFLQRPLEAPVLTKKFPL
jgi:hypothetical protein